MNGNFENNEFFRQLPEETKEKLRHCRSEEEAMEILKGDMVAIPDELLDSVAGGEGYICWDIVPCDEHKDQYDVCPLYL